VEAIPRTHPAQGKSPQRGVPHLFELLAAPSLYATRHSPRDQADHRHRQREVKYGRLVFRAMPTPAKSGKSEEQREH